MQNKKRADLLKHIYKDWKVKSLNESGFFVIFNGFLENNLLKEITGGALKLYIFLGIKSDNMTGESFYTVEQISEYFNVSQRTVSNWIAELEKRNLIIRYQIKFNSVSHTYLNIYDSGKKRKNSIL